MITSATAEPRCGEASGKAEYLKRTVACCRFQPKGNRRPLNCNQHRHNCTTVAGHVSPLPLVVSELPAPALSSLHEQIHKSIAVPRPFSSAFLDFRHLARSSVYNTWPSFIFAPSGPSACLEPRLVARGGCLSAAAWAFRGETQELLPPRASGQILDNTAILIKAMDSLSRNTGAGLLKDMVTLAHRKEVVADLDMARRAHQAEGGRFLSKSRRWETRLCKPV